MKGDTGETIWSWIDQPHRSRGEIGGHSRPWSIRERLVSEAVGAEVRRLREEKGLSARELAGRLCISQPHLSYLETGRRPAWVSMLWDLSDLLDVPPEHFIKVASLAVERFDPQAARWRRVKYSA